MYTAPCSPVHSAYPRAAANATSREIAGDGMDQTLMRQVAAGDAQAFETLYRRYKPRLAGYLTRRVNEPTLVDEISNDVMLVVWRRAATFTAAGRVSTWILGIATRKARKARAVMARQRLAPPAPLPVPVTSEGPEADLRRHEHTQLIAHALAALPPEQRQVILWTYAQQWPMHRIAAHTDEPVSTVKSRLQRARHHLGRILTRLEAAAEGREVAHTLRPSKPLRAITGRHVIRRLYRPVSSHAIDAFNVSSHQ
jgi:RNA polymerase sigma factor (sigma-70 family)